MQRMHEQKQQKNFKAALLAVVTMLVLFCIYAPAETPTESPATDKKRRLTNFEWDAMAGAKSYEIEIKPKKTDAKAFMFQVTTTAWNGDLKPGKYTMRLRSRDHRGVPGEWSTPEEFVVKIPPVNLTYPKDNSEIKTTENEEFELELKWDELSSAKSYQVTVKNEAGDVVSTANPAESSFKIKLPVAKKYKWEVFGLDELNEKGQMGETPSSFILLGKSLDLPKIQEPPTAYVRTLSWNKSNFAEKYEYTLKRKDNSTKKWKTIKTEQITDTKIPFAESYKGGQYQLRVTAMGTLRQTSKSHQINFPVAFGDRSAAAETKALSRKSIERIKSWYFIASYLITQIDYKASNLDRGSGSSTKAFGGTGRLGLGWLDEESPLGFLGIVDLSGFIIAQKNYTYPAVEAHGIIRYVAGELGEFRLTGGGYYKEIPEILANARTGAFLVSQLGAFGVHGGGEYWYSMTSKLGLQLNGRVYYPISGKTPTGQQIIPVLSYQAGFLGSYRLNDKATGLMGYAYRKDAIHYKSANNDVDSSLNYNQSSVIGNYLNFFLEWQL